MSIATNIIQIQIIRPVLIHVKSVLVFWLAKLKRQFWYTKLVKAGFIDQIKTWRNNCLIMNKNSSKWIDELADSLNDQNWPVPLIITKKSRKSESWYSLLLIVTNANLFPICLKIYCWYFMTYMWLSADPCHNY